MKLFFALLLGYAAFVACMEVALVVLQPDMDIGVELTTRDAEGRPSTRKLAGFRFRGHLYVSSNHWLRGWYRSALARPDVAITIDGEPVPHRAVPIEGDERARVADAYRMGFLLRFICGFAPSRFLRLDPAPLGV
ncbi:MAG: hypothetical protein AAGC67_14475 [Myxococcota bacterium]